MNRVLEHMNADHKHSLLDFVIHYDNVKIDDAHPRTKAEMIDIQLDQMKIEYYDGQTGVKGVSHVPIDPAMTSMTEVRSKLVEMAHKAAKARGLSAHHITRYIPPSSFVSYAVIASELILVVQVALPWLFSGSKTGEALLSQIQVSASPLDPSHKFWIFLFLATYSLHLVETVFYTLPLVKKYRIRDSVRAKWVVYGFLEGFPALGRLKKEAKRVDFQS